MKEMITREYHEKTISKAFADLYFFKHRLCALIDVIEAGKPVNHEAIYDVKEQINKRGYNV